MKRIKQEKLEIIIHIGNKIIVYNKFISNLTICYHYSSKFHLWPANGCLVYPAKKNILTKNIFATYNGALKNNGFNEILKFSPTIPTRRHRRKNITWFNQSFSVNVKTNVGKLFLTLLQKHFPGHHKYHKSFNKNNVKISYSCIPNMKRCYLKLQR